MRIVIEIDGKQETVLSGPDAAGAQADEAAADGGEGPAGGAGGTEAVDVAVLTDSGPPPDWLLEAVAVAEAEGRNTSPAQAADAADAADGLGDAGVGPSA